MKTRCFGILGGDRRQTELSRLLERDGHTVYTYGLCPWNAKWERPLTAMAETDCVLLPMPLCKEKNLLHGTQLPTAAVFQALRPGQLALAGKVAPEQWKEADRQGVELVDYLRREELAVANAIPTAEGALQLAMEQLPVTLCEAEAMIFGYGRIGKQLTQRLTALGARVTVAARAYGDRTWAKSMGCRTVKPDALSGHLDSVQVLFNTIPATVLDEACLRQLPTDCLCIDLASQAGWDHPTAEHLGLTTIWARGLPGKVAPVTAAAAIRDAIYHILEERGDLL